MKIEIGPGTGRIDNSWITVAPYEAGNVDVVACWGEESLPFKDASVDLIYASHVLEHIWWYKTVEALKDVCRILKPGGKLEVHVPDFSVIVEAYRNKRCGDGWRAHNEDGDYMLWANGRIFTYGGPGNTHRATFDRQHLTKCLLKAGFTQVLPSAPIRGHNHGPINLGMTAIK